MNPTDLPEYSPFVLEQMPHWMQAILAFLKSSPVLTGLFMMMLADMVSGICVAISKKALNSTLSWRGCCRKVIMVLLVGVSAILEPFAGGLPLTKLVACFFLYSEALSVLENAAAIGVPLPRALVDTLVKLRESAKTIQPPGSNQSMTVTTKFEANAPMPVKVSVEPTKPDDHADDKKV